MITSSRGKAIFRRVLVQRYSKILSQSDTSAPPRTYEQIRRHENSNQMNTSQEQQRQKLCQHQHFEIYAPASLCRSCVRTALHTRAHRGPTSITRAEVKVEKLSRMEVEDEKQSPLNVWGGFAPFRILMVVRTSQIKNLKVQDPIKEKCSLLLRVARRTSDLWSSRSHRRMANQTPAKSALQYYMRRRKKNSPLRN